MAHLSIKGSVDSRVPQRVVGAVGGSATESILVGKGGPQFLVPFGLPFFRPQTESVLPGDGFGIGSRLQACEGSPQGDLAGLKRPEPGCCVHDLGPHRW